MIKTGGPAFPQGGLQGARNGHGMSMRDYFAAKAMQGIHASLSEVSGWPTDESLHEIAILAYKQADAMIEARGKQDET